MPIPTFSEWLEAEGYDLSALSIQDRTNLTSAYYAARGTLPDVPFEAESWGRSFERLWGFNPTNIWDDTASAVSNAVGVSIKAVKIAGLVAVVIGVLAVRKYLL